MLVREMGPMRILDVLDYPDDDDFGMASGGRFYPMSADVAGALTTSAMMLDDRSEVSMRIGREHRDAWERERGWKYYCRIAPSGAYLRWDGRLVSSRRQAGRERGEWPAQDRDAGGWWPLADDTPTLAQTLDDLTTCRARAGLNLAAAWSEGRDAVMSHPNISVACRPWETSL